MPTASEVSTRLTADNSVYRSVMNQSVDVAGRSGKAILNKLDIKAGTIAIAAAVGFNLQSIAENLARRVIGFSKQVQEELEKTVAATQKAAEEEERQLAELRARKEKDAEAERDRVNKQAELVREQRVAAMEDAREAAAEEIRLRRAANAELSRLDNEAAESKMTSAQRLADLRAQAVAAEKEIAELTRKGNKRTAEETQTLIELKEAQADVQDKIKGLTKDTVTEEAKLAPVIEEAKTANDSFLESMNALFNKTASVVAKWKEFQAVTTTGRGDKDLTDAELERKIKQIEDTLFMSQATSYGAPPSFFEGPQRSNLAQAQAELDLRNRVRSEAELFGRDFAFQQNPGISEQRLGEILNGIDTSPQGRIAKSLERLNKVLQQGVPTVLFGGET